MVRKFNGIYAIKNGYETWKLVFLGDPSPSSRKMNSTEYIFHGPAAQKESAEKQLVAEEKKAGRKLISVRKIGGI